MFWLVVAFISGTTPAIVNICTDPTVTVPVIGPVDPSQNPQPQPTPLTLTGLLVRCDAGSDIVMGDPANGGMTFPAKSYTVKAFPDLASCQAAGTLMRSNAANPQKAIRSTSCVQK